MWIYEGKEFDEAPKEFAGFVYLITDLETGKKYIGKKWFWGTRMLKPLKGKSRRRKKIIESDWREYYGSSDEIKELLTENRAKRFKREILRLCKTKGDCSYYEAKLQFEYDVLLKPDEFYNSFIGCKIHRKHVLKST